MDTWYGTPYDRQGNPITCQHSWHYAPDGLPTCRSVPDQVGDGCHGITMGCGQGSIVCQRHLDRLAPASRPTIFEWFRREGV